MKGCIILNIDYNKCKQVVEKLNDFFSDNKQLAMIGYPPNIEYKTDEYYIYMFYSCLLDYGMRSKLYHQNLINTYMKYPKLFNPDYVRTLSEEDLKNIIVHNIHPRYPNIATKKWRILSKGLERMNFEYLKSIGSFQELKKFIMDFKCYGQKTGGLLIRIICDSKICNFEEEIEAIPIDRHDIEISYFTGMIDSKNIKDKDISKLSDAYVKAGKELHINPSDIDKYLWELGNSFCSKKKCEECPLNQCLKKQEQLLNKEG